MKYLLWPFKLLDRFIINIVLLVTTGKTLRAHRMDMQISVDSLKESIKSLQASRDKLYKSAMEVRHIEPIYKIGMTQVTDLDLYIAYINGLIEEYEEKIAFIRK